MSDIAIRVRGLSKSYTIRHQNSPTESTLAETLLKRLRNPLSGSSSSETFWALKDIDFEIKKGDVVGVIGRNGAGKSTLLKILSRITEPTTGRIELFGRIGSLLEVGTGFHPELTGRENIFLNGAILGMTRAEIKKQFDGIVDFSGVEKFLDTPVKRYSSGMYVRLAFAVAAHLETEILIVDEVLAVGDAEFQKKCLGKMKDVSTDGRTVLFVSHNLAAVRELCTHGLYLKHGTVQYNGTVGECVKKFVERSGEATATILSHAKIESSNFNIEFISFAGSEHDDVKLPLDCEMVQIEVHGSAKTRSALDIEGYLYDQFGVRLGQFSPTRLAGGLQVIPIGRFVLKSIMRLPRLNRGIYKMDLFLTHPMHEWHLVINSAVTFTIEGSPFLNGSVLDSATAGPIQIAGSTQYNFDETQSI